MAGLHVSIIASTFLPRTQRALGCIVNLYWLACVFAWVMSVADNRGSPVGNDNQESTHSANETPAPLAQQRKFKPLPYQTTANVELSSMVRNATRDRAGSACTSCGKRRETIRAAVKRGGAITHNMNEHRNHMREHGLIVNVMEDMVPIAHCETHGEYDGRTGALMPDERREMWMAYDYQFTPETYDLNYTNDRLLSPYCYGLNLRHIGGLMEPHEMDLLARRKAGNKRRALRLYQRRLKNWEKYRHGSCKAKRKQLPGEAQLEIPRLPHS